MKIKFKMNDNVNDYGCKNQRKYRTFEGGDGEFWTLEQATVGDFKGIWSLSHFKNKEDSESCLSLSYDPWVDGFGSIAQAKEIIQNYYERKINKEL